MRYLGATSDTFLCFTTSDSKLERFVDTELAGDIDSRKSITGFTFTLSYIVVSWGSNLQKVIALSTTEVEYVAMTKVAKEMILFQTFIKDFG